MRTRRVGALLDEADALHPGVVAGIAAAHPVQEAAIDLVDDFQLPGNERLEQVDRPLLQRLRKQGVIGIGQRALRDAPGLVPGHVRLIQQDPHQLGHAERGMRVVHLHGHVIREG